MRRTRSACCARRGERPCCAAETRDELPPSHFRPPRNSAEPIALGAAWEPDRRVCGCAVWSVPGPQLPTSATQQSRLQSEGTPAVLRTSPRRVLFRQWVKLNWLTTQLKPSIPPSASIASMAEETRITRRGHHSVPLVE